VLDAVQSNHRHDASWAHLVAQSARVASVLKPADGLLSALRALLSPQCQSVLMRAGAVSGTQVVNSNGLADHGTQEHLSLFVQAVSTLIALHSSLLSRWAFQIGLCVQAFMFEDG
jgi:hypothetical protein